MANHPLWSNGNLKQKTPHGKQFVGDYVQQFFHTFVGEIHSQPTSNMAVAKNTLLDVLGETTNTILYAHFSDNQGVEFSRRELQHVVENRKQYHVLNNDTERASKIQSGKLAVDYWIDFFVEKKIIEKRTSNPVLFKMVEKTITVEATTHQQDSTANGSIAA